MSDPAGAAPDPVPGRLASLRDRLAEEELDALVVSHPPNFRYLSGFTGSAGLLLVRGDGALLVVDGRYDEQAGEEAGAGIEVRVAEESLRTLLGEALAAHGGRPRVGLEAHRLTVEAAGRIREAAGDVEWSETTDLVEDLRAVKDPDEVRRIARAAEVACRALEELLSVVEEGVSEQALVAELEYRLRAAGSGRPAFDSIVASGPRSALPHATPGERRVREGDLVLLDFGATVEGYCSDLTRTVVLGAPREWQREIQEAVRAARDAAVEATAPGREAREVDRAAREVLEDRGLGESFPHSTGHGLGLEVHEGPSLSRKSDEILRDGNVVTIEPGVYLRGRGGIRLEDDVVVADDPRVLTDAPRALREL